MRSPRTRRQGERGIALVVMTLMLAAMLGVAALAVDLGNARQVSRHQQASTDAAALGGANFLPFNGAVAAQLQAARDDAARLMAVDLGNSSTLTYGAPTCTGTAPDVVCTYTMGEATVTVETPVNSVSFSGIPAYNLIRVRACQHTPAIFGQVVGYDGETVCRESIARNRRANIGGGRGLIALDPAACPAMEFSGSFEGTLTSNGAILVDSACPQTGANSAALVGGGSAWEVTAGVISVVGGVALNPCDETSPTGCTNGTVPLTGQPPAGDPYRSLPELPRPASAGSCTAVGRNWTCTPGYYTSEISFGGSADSVTFQPGSYYLEDGLSLSNNLRVTATEVLWFVDGGLFDFGGNSSSVITAPSTGTYEDISVFVARDNCGEIKINGTPGVSMGGIYAPCNRLVYNGNAGGNTADFTINGIVVSDTSSFSGSVDFTINIVTGANQDPPLPDIGLQQ